MSEHSHHHPENEHHSKNEENHSQHTKENGGHHAHHGHMVGDFKKRFGISLFLTIPILILSPMIQMFLGVDLRFPDDLIILFILSTILFFYGGWPFLKGAKDELADRSPGMMTLISMAIIVAYVYSSVTVFTGSESNFFWELATLISIMLLGHWIEMRSIMGASKALEELAKLMPSEAHLVLPDGLIKDVQIEVLKNGDSVLIKPGEKVPTDGEIVEGQSTIDESMLTGESVPINRQTGEEVIGGSVNGEGALTITVKKTGNDTYLSQVLKLVKEAQESKSKTQDFSNKAAKWLFYFALLAGISTFIIWISLGYPVSFAIERMVTVMIISCPHALGLAAPLVTAVSTSISAKKGLLIRNRAQFEEARNINTIVFDKTGTLTQGQFGVTSIDVQNGYTEEDVLTLAASVEAQSEHPIAKGIVREGEIRDVQFQKVTNFQALTGEGLQATVNNKSILVVSPGYVNKQKMDYNHTLFNKWSSEGKTVVFVIAEEQLVGMIASSDIVRDTAKQAVQQLKDMNIESIMLTGDNRQVAQYVGKKLHIDQVFAEVLPHQKSEKLSQLMTSGKKVAMTGDGVNDAPALAIADLGIAIGAGTDVAIETADVILVKSNPLDVVNIIKLSKATYRKMVQNLWWAAGYNIVAIPLAAGALYSFGIVLSPALGAVLMSLSTIVVAINAKLLRI